MKFSEAILEGCKVTKPGFGYYFDDKDRSACVIGAAAHWSGHNSWGKSAQDFINEKFGLSLKGAKPVNTLPLNKKSVYFTSLFDQLTSLNDYRLMTREEIAEGLAKAGL